VSFSRSGDSGSASRRGCRPSPIGLCTDNRNTRNGFPSGCQTRFSVSPINGCAISIAITTRRIALRLSWSAISMSPPPNSSSGSTSLRSPHGNPPSALCTQCRRTKIRVWPWRPTPKRRPLLCPSSTRDRCASLKPWATTGVIWCAVCLKRCSMRGSARSRDVPMHRFSARHPATTRWAAPSKRSAFPRA
jgi:hypothetical protein